MFTNFQTFNPKVKKLNKKKPNLNWVFFKEYLKCSKLINESKILILVLKSYLKN